MHFTKMFSVCCAIVFGAFMTSNVMAQGGCLNTAAFAGADITVEGPNGQLIGISTCSYEIEYSTITGVPAGEDIQFLLMLPETEVTSLYAGILLPVRL